MLGGVSVEAVNVLLREQVGLSPFCDFCVAGVLAASLGSHSA